MQINETRNRQREQSILVADLIDQYMDIELAADADWRSYATRSIYREFLTRWIKPHWGSTNIRDVRIVTVENWLSQLQRQDGNDLANSTKATIRNLMSVLFNHAIRYEWLEQGKNPITLVRQSALRKVTPTVLETHEIQSLLIANGENVKVVQELMRHANSRCTLDVIRKRESARSARRNNELFR